MRDAVIVDAVRTPIGKRNGSLTDTHPADLTAHVLNALVGRTGLDPALVDDVVWGCVSQVGDQAGSIGRVGLLAAGWPESVPSTTVDRRCGSSQQSVHFAADRGDPGRGEGRRLLRSQNNREERDEGADFRRSQGRSECRDPRRNRAAGPSGWRRKAADSRALVVNSYFAWDAYKDGTRANTPAPVGDGMIGGSTGEGILNAAGSLAGGGPGTGTALRQSAELGSAVRDPGKLCGRRQVRRQPDVDRDGNHFRGFPMKRVDAARGSERRHRRSPGCRRRVAAGSGRLHRA